jgi:hypothetical protein
MKRFFALTAALAVTFAALSLSVLPTMAAPTFPPPVVLSDSAPDSKVAVAPGGSVTVMLAGEIPAGYSWRVTWVQTRCIDDPNVQRNDEGSSNCVGEDVAPQPNALGNGYVSNVELLKVTRNVRIVYALFPPYRDGAGESNSATKVFMVEIVVEP